MPAPAVPLAARRWAVLAVASLVIAGLLSLLVVVGRLPFLSGAIADPLFFKRCLVVHVDLALVVWFYAFLAALLGLRPSHATAAGGATMQRTAFTIATFGVGAMLAGALARGAQPILANYVPVIDHPLFLGGLVAFFGGITLSLAQALAAGSGPGGTDPRASVLPGSTVAGLQAAAIAVVLAGVTAISAAAGLPRGLDPHTHFEFLAWGPGHALQVANTAAMLAAWLWLLERATGSAVMSPRTARGLFACLLAPHFALPLLTWRGTLNNLYHDGATQLMRWGIFPVVLVVLALGVRHVWRTRASRARSGAGLGPARDGASDAALQQGVARAAFAGVAASAGLALLGFILGACIRSSTTLVPAHYHASLGAVTVAFMAAAYLICHAAARDGLAARAWTAARRQLVLFFAGQSVFALGFALAGAHGLGRKAYADEQHVRSAGELLGLGVMGTGGLIAAAAGVWFLVLVLRAMRGWTWREAAPVCEPVCTQTSATIRTGQAGRRPALRSALNFDPAVSYEP